MNETIMKALMRLFAIAASVNEEGVSPNARTIVASYLKTHLTQELMVKYLALFKKHLDDHYKRVKRKKGAKQAKEATLNSVKVLMICQQINETLEQREKVIVFIRLTEFIHEDGIITDKEFDFILTVAETFNISTEEFENLMGFITGDFDRLKNKSKLLVISSEDQEIDPLDRANKPELYYRHIHEENLLDEILILHLGSTNTFVFRYTGEETVYLNGQEVAPRQAYTLSNGCIIKSPRIRPIYYSDVAGKFLHETTKTHINFHVENAHFYFKNSTNGIQPFSLQLENGQLVGIMGGSGVGKSTLFNLLNGMIRPQDGKILINGYDLNDKANDLNGIIGFVPQDDLLIEELTVYENLYYNAKLCFSNFTEPRIIETVNKMLADLELDEIKDLTVGNPLNKFISGGQRKRLNIALELIREPSILFVDEPTSGLSSMDSETVMLLLKEQTIKGRLVVINIHQPSSDVYKLFDKLLILDKGGRLIYNGNPIDAIGYFKQVSHHVNPNESECTTCGNVNPEQVLQIVEAKMVNGLGQFTRQRKISPEEWYIHYKNNLEVAVADQDKEDELPFNYFKVPGLLRQFKIFFQRNLMAKLTNTQYILINLLQAPVLAFILAYATKYIVGTDDNPMEYIFSENKNLPGYLFMGIIVALFLGLTVSAEEIIKDRRILQRESFLNLSRFSYINSKIGFLFILSAFQTLTFVLIGNFIFEIESMTLAYWILLFTTASWANLIGLNISSGLNSVVAIYILIPFILVPQLLLSGAMISFDNLHKRISSQVVVPFIGDMMVSRWVYEAMCVYTFKENDFQKHFFDVEFDHSDAAFKKIYLLPRLKSLVDECETNLSLEQPSENEHRLLVVRNEIEQLQIDNPQLSPFEDINLLTTEAFSFDAAERVKTYFSEQRTYFSKVARETTSAKEARYKKMVNESSKSTIFQLQQKSHNKALSGILMKRMELKKVIEDEGRLVQNLNPIYRKPASKFGRAHFYAPYKRLFKLEIPTFWFNVIVVWIMIAILYLLLWHNSLRKLLDYIDGIKLRSSLKKKGAL